MKILCVDDSELFIDLLLFALQDGGYSEIDTALSGKIALQKAKSNTYDLIITDLRMPKMDGIELTSLLRAIPKYKTTPILILSADSDQSLKNNGKDNGVTGWIVKPFLPDQLLKAIDICKNIK